jgi:hypothetical protein
VALPTRYRQQGLAVERRQYCIGISLLVQLPTGFFYFQRRLPLADWVRIGKALVNLDNVTHVCPATNGTLLIRFRGGEPGYIGLTDETEKAALVHWISRTVPDLVQWEQDQARPQPEPKEGAEKGG